MKYSVPDVVSLRCFILPCWKKNKAQVAQVTDVSTHTHGPFTSVTLDIFLFQGPVNLNFPWFQILSIRKRMFITKRAFYLQTVKFFPERKNDSFHCWAYKCCEAGIIWIDTMLPSRLQNPPHFWGSGWEQIQFGSWGGSKMLFSGKIQVQIAACSVS